jgi:hypothetical protein
MVARASSRREPPREEREDRTRGSNAPKAETYGGASIEELEKGLKIGTDLEQEDRVQAETYWRVARASAVATSRRDAAYQNIKDVEAEESLKIRESYTKEDKVTEATITAETRSSPHVRMAVKNHLRLQEEAAVLNALLMSFEKRSYALRDLVQMQLKEFYQSSGTRDGLADMARREQNERRRDRDEDRRPSRGRDRD